MLEALELPFFQRVLAAGVLASIACGVVGSFVVVKRMASVSGGLSHAAFGGVGLGYLLGLHPMLGATAFALAAGVAVSLAHFNTRTSLDTLISMMWSVGMASGILFVAMAPGYAPDLTSYLFGSLLLVPWEYVALVAAVDVVIVVAVYLFFPRLQAVAFDEEYAEVVGVPVRPMFLLLLCITSLTVVTLIRVVGIILTVALLTMPAATARLWCSGLRTMMIVATGLAAICTSGGLILSYAVSDAFSLPLPPGPIIILLAASGYAASGLVRVLQRRRT